MTRGTNGTPWPLREAAQRPRDSRRGRRPPAAQLMAPSLQDHRPRTTPSISTMAANATTRQGCTSCRCRDLCHPGTSSIRRWGGLGTKGAFRQEALEVFQYAGTSMACNTRKEVIRRQGSRVGQLVWKGSESVRREASTGAGYWKHWGREGKRVGGGIRMGSTPMVSPVRERCLRASGALSLAGRPTEPCQSCETAAECAGERTELWSSRATLVG